MAPNTATGTRPSARRARRGFTIIELLIVMTLIIILASVGMTQYRNSVTRAEEAVLKENLFRMRDAMDQFYADKNKWPADLAELVSEGYIREVPDRPDDQVEGHLADETAPSRMPNNPGISRRHQQRAQRLGSHGARRHAIRGVELDAESDEVEQFDVAVRVDKGPGACARWPFRLYAATDGRHGSTRRLSLSSPMLPVASVAVAVTV